MQRLTLCMIVKNEESLLPGCLASVRGLVDAIVVVDTGSSDRTVEIAEGAGAQVVRHEWNDDFSAARNAALEPVKGGFVLVLDADERLGPGAKRALRKALKTPGLDCGMLPLHHAAAVDARLEDVVSGAARRGEPILLPRLFRRTPDLRWEGIVHEQVTGWIQQPGRKLVELPAPIVHLGAVPELREELGKDERNLRLLARRCEAEPTNPTPNSYYAVELHRAGRLSEALERAGIAWDGILAQAGDDGRPTADSVMPATLHAFLLLQEERHDEAAAVLAKACEWNQAHPNLDLLAGVVAERRALVAADVETYSERLGEAEAAYRRCLSQDGKGQQAELMPGATSWAARTRLASIDLLAGRPEPSLAGFEAALKENPNLIEAHLGRLEALLDAGRPAEVLAGLQPFLSPECADAWLLGAAAAYAFGQEEDARLFLGQVRNALAKGPWIAIWRAARLVELQAELDERAEGAEAASDPSAISPGADATVSVVIPAYNRLDLLAPVLEGFAREAERESFELVIVDDGSEPPVESLFETLERPANLVLLRRENGGRGPALNTGIDAATGSIVIVCDSDIVPEPGFVREHAEFHRRNPSELATHMGALEWGLEPDLFSDLMGPRSNPRFRDGRGQVPWTTWFTDNWSFKKRLLDSRGLRFDPAYRTWGWEEIDLARELVAAGATNTITGRAVGRHLKPAGPEGMLRNFAASVPNLVHLACKAPDDPVLANGLSCRWKDAESLKRAGDLLEWLWNRCLELDLRTKAERPLRDPSDPLVHELACALSDTVFRVGIARGFAEQDFEVTLQGLNAPAPDDDTQLLLLAQPVAMLTLAEALWAGSRDSSGLTLGAVAILGLKGPAADRFLAQVEAFASRAATAVGSAA